MNIFDAHISGSLSVSASAEISNNLSVSGNLNVLGTINGSVSGNTTSADTASFAPKYTLTSSFQTFTSSYTTGSFTGSFKGDGTNLYNIPASGVTGLNLTRIADGVATASISNASGLRVNSNTEITGALKLNKVDLSDDIIEITLTDGGGKYYINGVKNPKLSFTKGFKYRFYYNNINTHPLLFSLTSDGEHNGGTIYTTGVTTNADPFYIEVDVTNATATTFYYWCDHHVGMGNSISVYSDFLSGQAIGDLIVIEPGTLATTGSNNFIGNEKISGSLSVTGSLGVSGSLILTGSVDITGSMTLNGQPIGTGKLDETTFQSYTSSNDSTNTTQNSRLTSIESTTSSLNSFTSSIDNTIKNKLNTESVITGSVQVLITGTTGYSTFSSSISTSIGSLSSSVATTTSGLSSSIDSLSSSVATTTSGLSSSVATTTSGLSSSIGSLSSSFSSTNDTQNGKLTSIETTTGSLNTFTSSIDTTIKNKLNTETVISGSVQVLITGTTGYSSFSSSISTSLGLLSSSVTTTTSGLSSSIGSLSSSFSSTNDAQNSKITSIETSTSSLNSYTSSNTTNINEIHTSTGSLNSYTSSNTTNISAIHTSTGSLNTFSSSILASIELTGSNLTVKGDLLVKGTTTQIDSTTVNIGDNIIQLNGTGATNAGIVVRDATAPNTISGSLLWDTTNDYWKAGIVGGEERIILVNEYSTFSTSIDSRATSLQTSTSSLNTYTSSNNTNISAIHTSTGSLNTFTSSANIKFGVIETSTSSLNTFTSSLLTAIELTGSNLTVKGNFLVKGTTTNVNTTTLDVDNNLINLNGNGASFAGIRVKDTTGPNLISGSILWDSANDYWIAGQLGSEQRLVRETEFNNAVTRVGNVETSTGSLNSFTSSINTTIKTKLNTEGVLSGSVQVNHNATTNYVANQHIDHTTVSITAGSGLTGGGDISTTRTINIGAGNGITVNADDIAIDTASATFTTGVKSKLNTDGVISGSAQIDGSLLGSNKTITIGSTSTTLGGTSTSLAGLTSVTSTAFTGSLQGGISGNAATVTNGVYTTGDQSIAGVKTFSDTLKVLKGSRTLTIGQDYANHINWDSNVDLALNISNGGSGGIVFFGGGSSSKFSVTSAGVGAFAGNLSAANLSGTNTGDETLARVNALAITTVGTITSGTWNGSAIGNAYLANSSFNIGTTSISLGRASASQTLTGVSIDGASASAPILTASGGLTTQQGNGTVGYVYALASSTTGIFAVSDNSNSILTVNRHPDNYYSQLGFSSNGNLYYRSFSATAINTSQAWKTLIDSGNIASQTVTNITASSNTSLTSLANLATVGTIGTGVWNGSSIGTAYTAAKVTAVNAGTGVGVDTTTGSVTVSIGQAVATSSNVTFARVTTPKIAFERNANTANGLSWYSFGTYTAWCDYMANGGATSTGPTGNITASTGTYVTSWARRFFVEDANTYGWIFEKGGTTSTTPTVVAELRSSDGLFSTAGAIYSAGSLVKTSANSSYSTSFSSVSSVTVTHSLGTKDVAVFVYDSSDNMFWPSSIVTTSTSVVTITFASSRSGRVVVVR